MLLIIAGVVTVAVNADSLRMAERLWYDDEFLAAVVEAAEPYIEASVKRDQASAEEKTASGGEERTPPLSQRLEALRGDLGTFPIGYSEGFNLVCCLKPSMIAGWLLTVAAISLGAPFWFDLLGKVAHLRGSGTREADRARKPGSALSTAAVGKRTEGGT